MIAKILLAIGILLAIVLLGLALAQTRNNAEIARIEEALQASSPSAGLFDPQMVADLPEPVQRYFRHAIAPGTPLANAVRLQMRGDIRLAPDQDWMPLQAEEMLAAQGFVWTATAGKGMMQMRGADYYFNGDGRMRFSLWGIIPLVTAQGSDVMRSAIGRMAGEWFWLPAVLLPQRGVIWQALDQNKIQARLKVENEPIALTFTIDDRGRLLQGTLLRWGNQTEDGHYAEIPFGGNHQAERTFGGYTIPVEMGAGWWIGTDRYFEFFRVTIEQAKFY